MRHFISNSLTANSVTVSIIGAGGTGSQFLTGLARLDVSLRAIGHPGLHVTVADPDTVSDANVGRQLFSPTDIGLSKASVLVTRINQYFGLSWKSLQASFDEEVEEFFPDLVVTAVDNVKTRLLVGEYFKRVEDHPEWDGAVYWLDMGNTRNTGQVVLGTFGEIRQPEGDEYVANLPCVTDLYDLTRVRDEDQGPSCSLAAALESQDLMINQMVSTCALQILWRGFRNGYLEHHGAFINLNEMRVNPLPVDPKVWERMKT